jgi:hypothetical protein
VVYAKFRRSLKVLIFTSILVAGLGAFVWIHYRGQRIPELYIFSVLFVLSVSLYGMKKDLAMNILSREITGRFNWLGFPLAKIVVRVPIDGSLVLMEDREHSDSGNVGVWLCLCVTGELVEGGSDDESPYEVIRHVHLPNREILTRCAEDASKQLNVPLIDKRRYKKNTKI